MAVVDATFVVPAGYYPEMSDKEIIALLPDVIKELLTTSGSDTKWQVVKYRFGFGNVQRETLEEIAELLGVSKQRVQQIEARAIGLSFGELVDGRISAKHRGARRSIHPTIVGVAKKISLLLTEGCSDIERESHIIAVARQRLGWELDFVDSTLEFFLPKLGFTKVSFKSRSLRTPGPQIQSGRAKLTGNTKSLKSGLGRYFNC